MPKIEDLCNLKYLYSMFLSHLQSTRLSTFYNGRKRKALEVIRKSLESNSLSNNGLYSMSSLILSDVDLALSGFSRVLSVECGEDLSKIRLEILGNNEGRVSGLPGGNVIVPKGVSEITNILASRLPQGCVRLKHHVKSIDWSLLSRNPRLPDKITVDCISSTSGGLSSTPSRICHPDSQNTSNNLVSTSKIQINADFVVCTLPLGVLKSSHRKIFYPRLPDQKVSYNKE